MPGRDGTGPMGNGAMNGRRFGIYTRVNAVRNSTESGKTFIADSTVSRTQKGIINRAKRAASKQV